MVAKNKFVFTNKALETLPILATKSSTRTCYYDLATRGLALYVTVTGVKTFFVYRRVHGKPERIVIGRTSEVTLEQARAKADIINAQIANGQNPQEVKRIIRQDMKLGELWHLYLERHAKVHRSSWRHDVNLHKLYLAKWSEKKLSHITTQDIRNLHHKIGRDSGTVTANHVHALLRLMLNKAMEWGWDKAVNPAYAVKRFRETSRERFLSAAEMRSFLQALEQEPSETVRDYLYVSLFTGARRGNVQAMRWQDVDFATALWVIPKTKNGKQHIVTLAAPVVEILTKRLEKRKEHDSEFVFASAKSNSGHIENPFCTFKQVLKRAGITGLCIHDLRRTFGSWQASQGANSYIISKALGHTSPQSTAIYARLDLSSVRQSVSNVVEAMLDITKNIT